MGVEIVRSAGETRSLHDEDIGETAPEPRIVYIPNEALEDREWASCLDALEAGDQPTILMVGPPEVVVIRADAPAAQRRIDLLAIEQNAWRLAGLDQRCVVTHTRAEFEWALRNRKLSVWAPSKIVLDAVEPPVSLDGPVLAQWFAKTMNAKEILFMGCEPLQGDVPARLWPE